MFSDRPRNRGSLLVRVARACAATVLLLSGMTVAMAPAGALPTVQHLAIPAYFGPGSAYWSQLDQGAPAVGIVIANPNSGPGTAFDQGYANAIQAAAQAGVKVTGYVDTGYFGTTGRTTRTGQTSTSAWTTQVEGDVDNWYRWYGGYGLAGIFFDDAQNVCGPNNSYVNLYAAVSAYTKQNHGGALTVDNPGAAADQCYASAADILVMFEGTYSSYTSWSAPAWELNSANPNQFWHLVYGTTAQADMERAVSLSKQRNAGYLYVTNDVLPNPWDTLPTGAYWTDELAQTGAGGGGGDTSAPTAPANARATSVGTTSVTLTWSAATDNVGVTAYDVSSGSTRVATVTGTSATITGLAPGTTYTFSVTARDAAGNTSPSSTPVTVTTTTGGGTNCTPIAGSGDITDYSACMDATTLRFQATFRTAVSLHHVFINSDNTTATGYQLPSPSTSRLGADYMIENNTLYKSACTCWGWTAVSGVSPNMTVNGSTYRWTVPLTALTGPATTQQAELNGNTSYTPVITFSRA